MIPYSAISLPYTNITSNQINQNFTGTQTNDNLHNLRLCTNEWRNWDTECDNVWIRRPHRAQMQVDSILERSHQAGAGRSHQPRLDIPSSNELALRKCHGKSDQSELYRNSTNDNLHNLWLCTNEWRNWDTKRDNVWIPDPTEHRCKWILVLERSHQAGVGRSHQPRLVISSALQACPTRKYHLKSDQPELYRVNHRCKYLTN